MSFEDSCIILDDDTDEPLPSTNDSCIVIEDEHINDVKPRSSSPDIIEDFFVISPKKAKLTSTNDDPNNFIWDHDDQFDYDQDVIEDCTQDDGSHDDNTEKSECFPKSGKTLSKAEIQKKQAEENKKQRQLLKQQKEIEEKRKKAEKEVKLIHTASRAIFYCIPIIDQEILKSIGDSQGNFINTVFDENEIRHRLINNPPIPGSISWVRIDKEVIDKNNHSETSFSSSQPCVSACNTSFRVREFEKEENRLILVMTAKEYIDKITAFKSKKSGRPSSEVQPLDDYIRRVKSLSGGKYLTVMVYNLSSFFKAERAKEARSYRRNFENRFNCLEARAADSDRSNFSTITQEEVDSLRFLIDLELKKLHPTWKVQFRFFEKTEDIVEAFSRFTRSIASAPFKQTNVVLKGLDASVGLEKLKAYDPTVSIDDLKSLWINQLQMIPQITPTMAVAIADAYPCPMSLETAYQKLTREEAQELLADIRVQRNISQRNVGSTLSKRVHTVLTSRDPNLLLCDNQS